jgi:DNA-binding MarR family transcriptional regulator
LSDTRDRILKFLGRKTTATKVATTTIAEALNMRGDAVYQVLKRMADDGQLRRSEPRLTGREAYWERPDGA